MPQRRRERTTTYTAPAPPTLIEVFTSSGTWTKNTAAKTVTVRAIGSGGTGGSGRNTAASAGGGGGGAGAAGISELTFNAAALGATEVVTVGVTPSISGSDGVDSTFGNWLRATGGKGGGNSTSTAAGAGGAGGTGNF